MISTNVHRTTVIDNRRLISPGTRIGAGARLSGAVRTGRGVIIDFNVVIYGPVNLSGGTYVGANSVLGFPSLNELKTLLRSRRPKPKKLTTVGKNCVLRSGTILYSDVTVADDVSFGHNVLIRENVSIGTQTRIGTNVVIDGRTSIGANVSIQTAVYVCTHSKIEDGVFLGPCCVLTNDKYVTQKPFQLVGPTVRRGASIGANALLFPGITVGEGAVVGAQAMVNSDVPPRTIFAGTPARKIRDVPEDWHSSLLKD